MSGGIQEKIELESLTGKQKQQLWSLLLKAIKKNALMGCSMDVTFEHVYEEISKITKKLL